MTYGTLDQRDNPGAVGVQGGAGASYTQYGNAGSWDVRAGMRLIFYASTDVPPPGLRPIDATIQTTDVGRIPTALAVDSTRGHAFVASRVAGTITMLDAHTGALLRTVRVGRDPSALAVAAWTGRLFVADSLDDRVSVLDATSGALLRSTGVGRAPDAIAAVAIAARAGRIVAAGTDGRIRLLDRRTGALRSVTDVTGGDGYAALRLAVDEAKGHILVAASGPVNVERLFTAAGTLSVLDTRDGSVVGTAILGHSPVALVIDARGDRALVLDNADNTLSVLDDARL